MITKQPVEAVFPAPAGINRVLTRLESCLSGIPRASGDKPQAKKINITHNPYSPRQRG
ncbi:hypothetical protein [Salmonella enterica]|uniref:hypothetical protein n=1 Tax=Salmonella enterica TaxID=28901 RepID=UPI0019A87ECD|nr:hypothetical protein [Salmonella enterica subsp. enterica serovar Minnesota]EEP0473912.1 hypothetical protein [Salmonella enterica subsp. enterica serovar Minnesota]EEV5169376.1 hypothetical protein [Salmonella enterica subsp. enterica serovar Minnesota]EGK6986430.1 hypothetical protein [Salmonella enterica subsp. enterica serovar Minnesota]EGN0122035.1 hypothetical protein [Salmonella enterica subsp. enterica serovar Minnesota]